jgi:predicted metal-dependent phosphoesterase TrpH
MYKVDLHTHSTASPDGGLTAVQYHQVLNSGVLHAVAITDHNRIDFATDLHRKMGELIIVGEEIMTTAGEIIGLYLEKLVKPHQSPLATVKAIKDQGGLVYIPHPFETVRKGLSAAIMEELADYIDIIETCNGRAFFQNRASQAAVWARMANKLGAASSDAHGLSGLGTTYTSVSQVPTHDTLLALLANGIQLTGRPTVRALLYPKLNRLRKKTVNRRSQS